MGERTSRGDEGIGDGAGLLGGGLGPGNILIELGDDRGWFVGVGGAAAVFVLLAEVVDQSSDTPEWASWLRIVGGVALVAYGVKQWFDRHAEAEQPAWMRSISTASPSRAFRLALLLSAANPKVLLLAAAAGLVIGSDDFTARGDVVESRGGETLFDEQLERRVEQFAGAGFLAAFPPRRTRRSTGFGEAGGHVK